MIRERDWVGMTSWLMTGGKEDTVLEQEISQKTAQLFAKEGFSAKDVEYIATLKRPLLKEGGDLGERDFVQLRELCRLSNFNIQPLAISSHRPVIGKLIVIAKRALFPLIKQLLGGYVKEQRAWNAKLIEVTAETMQRVARLEKR